MGAKQSFFVFCYPFKMKISDAQQKFLDTAEQSRIPMDHFEIQVYKWGNGPRKILFVHGWRSNTFRWKRYINSFDPSKYTVYAFDAPGHGNSGYRFSNVPLFARSIELIFRHIGGVDALIGHSVGGFASIYFMHTNPRHQIKRFVSLAAPGSANDFIKLYMDTMQLSPRTEKNLRSYFVTYTGREVEQFDLEYTMDNMPKEGLIIHDIEDKDVPVSYAHEMHKLWPKSNLVITEGLGHKLRDQGVVDKVVEFVNTGK